MKFVPRRQRLTGEELHPLDSSKEAPNCCGPVFRIGLIIEWLDDEAHTLGLTQRQFLLGFENTMGVDSLRNLSHAV
jgi:hypothetical protein